MTYVMFLRIWLRRCALDMRLYSCTLCSHVWSTVCLKSLIMFWLVVLLVCSFVMCCCCDINIYTNPYINIHANTYASAYANSIDCKVGAAEGRPPLLVYSIFICIGKCIGMYIGICIGVYIGICIGVYIGIKHIRAICLGMRNIMFRFLK
jgi:hypothetical protein